MGLGKWIAGGLGWAFLGPIGGIIGFLVGSAIEKSDTTEYAGSKRTTTKGDFVVSLVVLTAAVLKADGVVKKGELDYVKKFFLQQFGKDTAADAIRMLRDVLKQNIPVDDVARQVGMHLDHSSKLQFLHYLFGIAQSDGELLKVEVDLIENISRRMGISNSAFNSIKSMFYKETDSAYKILGLTKQASVDDIKKAYRKMAVEYHPDKVAYLGEDVQKAAKEKFQRINEAYETLKKERGFS